MTVGPTTLKTLRVSCSTLVSESSPQLETPLTSPSHFLDSVPAPPPASPRSRVPAIASDDLSHPMYHQEPPQQQQRPRSRRRPPPPPGSHRDPLGRDLMSAVRDEENVQFRKRIYATKVAVDSSCGNDITVEENSFAQEFRRRSSNNASGMLAKTLVDEDMSNEVEIRLPAPGLIAKLMGLDATPPPNVVPRQRKQLVNFLKTSSASSQEKYMTYDDHSYRMRNGEHQEFKDVFEVTETSKFEKHESHTIRKGMSSSKQGETDTGVAFRKQKFMEGEYLPVDEPIQNFKDFNKGKEVLDCNNDIFGEYLPEPSSLFTKHLHDLKCAPPSRHESHINFRNETDEVCFTSGRNTERTAHMHRDAISSYRKPATSYACQSLREHSYNPDKLSESKYGGKGAVCHHPDRIVVLEASLEKAQDTARTFPSTRSHVISQVGCKRNMELLRSGAQELYSGGKDKHKLSSIGHKTKGSRNIARELTEQVRHTARNRSENAIASKLNGRRTNKSSRIRSDMGNTKKYEAFHRISDHFDEHGNSFGASSSVNREARKHLSERWRTTHLFQEVGPVSRGSNTLSEMLALSHKNTPKTITDHPIIHGVPKKEVARDEELGTWIPPVGIRNKVNCKDRCSPDMHTSTTLSASSPIYDNPKHSSNRFGGRNNYYILDDVLYTDLNDSLHGNFSRQISSSIRRVECHRNKAQIYSSDEEDKLPEREIHVEELENRIHVGYLDKEKSTISEISDNATPDRRHMVEVFSALKCKDERFRSRIDEELVKQLVTVAEPARDEAFPGYKKKDVLIKETLIKHHRVDSLSSFSNTSGSGSPVGLDKADKRSPVSILEPPEEKNTDSRCFNKISADLQDFRTQLQFLKLESEDTYAEEVVDTSSEDEIWEKYHSDILQAFRGEEDRDFSYLLDMVIESGIHCSGWSILSDACRSQECLVGADIFDRLEKKYSLLVSWSRTERKLLFDLVNAILTDNIDPYMDLHPCLNPKRISKSTLARGDFVEELWQMVASQRKAPTDNLQEKPLENTWLDLGIDVDLIGRDIEKMLQEELLGEFVTELILS